MHALYCIAHARWSSIARQIGVKTMTKKAEHAAKVAANKRTAWFKKVRTLTGHLVSQKMDMVAGNAAYDAGMSADAFAADLASREPVGAAVHALKVEVVKAAEQHAAEDIEAVRVALAAAGWDLNVARIQLSPCPIRGHKPPMKQPALVAWYGRRGFKMKDGCKQVMEK